MAENINNTAASNEAANLTALTTSDLTSAGSVYAQGVQWLDAYKTKQKALLAEAKECGEKLSPELDEKLTKWQVSAKKAAKTFEENRKPFTEKAHAFVKAFTAIENELLKDLYDPIQEIRNKSASIYAEEAKEIRRKEQEELRKKQARIEEVARVEGELRQGYASILSEYKNDLLTVFDGLTLENTGEVEGFLNSINVSTLPKGKWEAINLTGTDEINTEVRTKEKLDACTTHFVGEINSLAKHLCSQIPLRIEEIKKGIEKSKLAEEQRLAEEKAKNEAEAKAAKAAEEAKAKAELQVKISEANRQAEKSAAISKYELVVLNVKGWRHVIDYYLQSADIDSSELGKVRLESMRIFVERAANDKKGALFIESESLEYKPVYKAIARAKRKETA